MSPWWPSITGDSCGNKQSWLTVSVFTVRVQSLKIALLHLGPFVACDATCRNSGTLTDSHMGYCGGTCESALWYKCVTLGFTLQTALLAIPT